MIKFLGILVGIMALWGVISSVVSGFMSKKIKNQNKELAKKDKKIKQLKERIKSAGKTNQEIADIKKEKDNAKKKPLDLGDLSDI